VKAIGGKVAHIGLAVFFLGVIASGKYNVTRHVSLELNHPQQVLNHTLTYVGYTPTPDGKYAFNVNVESDGRTFRLSPLMFDAGQQGIMRNPDIASFLTSDFYLSPVSLEEPIAEHAGGGQRYTIEKGKAISLGDFKATFVRFDMSSHGESGMMSGGGMAVGSVLELTDGNRKETITPVAFYSPDGRQTFKPSESKLLDATVQLVSMNVGGMGSAASAITIDVRRNREVTSGNESLVVEVSTKPLIGLVWAGSIVMFLGFGLAAFKRLQEA
jgi:cytochrome c-type biogenesis protein CcmF